MKTTDTSNKFAEAFVFSEKLDLGEGKKWVIGITNKVGDVLISDHSCMNKENMDASKGRLSREFSELLAIFEQRIRRDERSKMKSGRIS